MPVSKAQQKAVNKYVKEKYDRVLLTMPKGQKEELQAHAAAHGESVNGFIGRAIKETIARDGAEKPIDAPKRDSGIPIPEQKENVSQAVSAPAIAVPLEKLNQAKAHAEARGETVSGFLVRAIDKTMERDMNAPAASQGDSEGDLNDND